MEFGPHVMQNGCRYVSCYKYIVILCGDSTFSKEEAIHSKYITGYGTFCLGG